MKIIQVQTQAEAAGAQRVSQMVGAGLQQRGHEVRTVFMYRKTDAFDGDPHADFILRQQPRGLVDQLRSVFGLFGYLMRHKPDAVLSYQHFGTVFGTIGGRLAGARHLIANQSGVPLRGGMRGIATALDKLMGTVGLYGHSVVNSEWTRQQFANYPARYQARLRRIDHGVGGPPAEIEQEAARAAFRLPEKVRLVVSTGRLNVLKNHCTLIDALAHLPDVHLAIAGAGPEREALVRRAESLQLRDRLHMAGEVAPERIFEFLAAGDVYAFPSLQETFGLAVAEAAIAGIAVVASDLPVLREVLGAGDGEPAALFADASDAAAFAGAIRTVLDDPQLAEQLRRAGRRLAERYSPEKMVLAYERLLIG